MQTTQVQTINKSDVQDYLEGVVHKLSNEIGIRSYLHIDALQKTSDYIQSEFKRFGYKPYFQSYKYNGNEYHNIIAELKGQKQPEKILIVGAHYDTVSVTPGADDNASGVAGLLALAKLLSNKNYHKTLQLVAFTLEEPPAFTAGFMGSQIYAKALKQNKELVEGMICLEMIGYFTDAKNSQSYPLPLFKTIYPDRGNFIAFVSNLSSRGFLRQAEFYFKKGSSLPLETLSAPESVPGVDFSDHRSFWEMGYKAIMITDTAFYRNGRYHTPLDKPETLDYRRMTEVVVGLKLAIETLLE